MNLLRINWDTLCNRNTIRFAKKLNRPSMMIFPGKLSHLGWRQLVSILGAFSEYCLLFTVSVSKLKNSTDHNDNTKAGCCSTIAAVCCTNFWDCGDVVSCVTGLAVTLSRCHAGTAWQQHSNSLGMFSLCSSPPKCWMKKIKRADEVWSNYPAGKLCFWAFYSEKSTKIMIWF